MSLRRLRRFIRAAAVLLVAFVLYLSLRRLNLADLTAAFRRADPALLVAAAVCSVAQLWCKAVMWRSMLRTDPPLRVGRIFRYTLTAFAASALTPARAGEVLRMWLLRRYHHVPYAQSTAVALLEKLLDAFGLSLFVIPLLWLPSPLKVWTRAAVLILVGVGMTGFGLATFATRHLPSKGRLRTFFLNVRILQKPSVLVRATLAAVGSSALDFATLWLSLKACGIGQDFAGIAFVLLVTNAVLVVPTTPGNLGSLEAGGIVAVGLLGVGRPQALAFVLIYHAVQLGPLILFSPFNLGLVLGKAPQTFTTSKG